MRRFGDLSRNNLSIPLELLNLSYSRTIEGNLVVNTMQFFIYISLQELSRLNVKCLECCLNDKDLVVLVHSVLSATETLFS